LALQFNTNLDALTATFNLLKVSSAISTSIQRLSSGLRINSAADDPAGLVIANSLQAQVDGLNQALENNQDSINLVKTASSGMDEINSLLDTIRQKALDAANTGATDPTAAQADQTAIQSAIQSINNIASSTQYGSKKLLDGSAGVTAAVTNSTLIGGINFGGTYGGGVTQAGNVTITVNNAATRAQVSGGTAATYASVNASISTVNGTTTGTGGTVVINGQTVTVSGTDTVQTLIDKINALTGTTGVAANFVSANGSGSITLTNQNYGANFKITESETAALIAGTAGTTVAGLNATVTVQASTLVGGNVTTVVATFTGGRYASDSGLRVTDTNGNSILLTEAGNNTSTSSKAVGAVTANSLQFQIGGGVGQTANIALNSVFASNLGTTSVPGQTLATIDVTTTTGANNALQIVGEAQNQINQYQAQLGGFQDNVLQATNDYLNNSVLNLTASITNITGANIAQEVMNLTTNQLIQQAGASALATAENLPAIYLKLLS